MGSNLSRESTLAVSSTPKPDPTVQRIRNERLAHLIDPRSPSTDIGRTPIQVAAASETSKVVTNGCALPSEDPRSPTIGITRTPVRDDMQVTVGSLARRLGILFYNEAASVSVAPPGRFSKPSNLNVEEENPITVTGELGSMKPLLACQPPQNFGTMAQHANLLSTPVKTHPLSTGDMSPFVLLEDLQIEVEADLTLEEAEEARESPVHKRLSMSLITCHEGAASSHIFAEVHCDSPSPVAAVETSRVGPDHSYAHASVTHEPASPQSPAQLDVPTMTEVSVSSEQLEEAQVSSSIETEESDTVPEPLMLLTTPADLEPHTSVALEPQTTPAALEPHTSVVREPQTTPAALEPQVTPATPEPIVPEAQAIPAAIEPQITPATPEPIVPEAQTTPAALEPHTSVALEPQTTPAALEPQITPATPEPIVPEAQVTPAALEPQITPATPEPIVPEAQVTPAAFEPQITPATPEPIVPEDQVTPAVLEPQITPEAQPMPTTLELQTTVTTTLKPPAVVGPTPSPQEVQSCKGLRCPNLKTKSPSQVVFKPQWLGKGFGATGLRARGVQAGRSKGGSSPLAVRVAVKNVFNDTRGQSTKPKDKGEGRSPLQILKETNSPREQSSQMKVKVSTPDRQRLGQLDRRTLAVSLDKENR